MEKGLTLRTGQTHVQKYLPAVLAAMLEDKIDELLPVPWTPR